MKRVLHVACIVAATMLLLMTLSGCSPNYDGWKEIEIPECGTIKIPKDWMMCKHDGKIYLTDRPLDKPDCNIYFFQITNIEQDTTVFSDNIQWVKSLPGEGFSNSAGVVQDRFLIDDNIQDMHGFWLSKGDLSESTFYTLDTGIGEDIIRKIAKSFKMSW